MTGRHETCGGELEGGRGLSAGGVSPDHLQSARYARHCDRDRGTSGAGALEG